MARICKSRILRAWYALSVVGWLLPKLAVAGCALRTMELPVQVVDQRGIATVAIDGVEVPLMVNTGAFYSSLSPDAAERLQLHVTDAPTTLNVHGLTGRVDDRIARVDKLKILQGEISGIDFLVGGHAHRGAMGVMGRNILSFSDTEYDLAHGVIRFVRHDGECSNTNMAYWAHGSPVTELRLQRSNAHFSPAIEAVASINGQKLRVEFDTGAMSLISKDAAKRLGLAWDESEPAGQLRGADDGQTPYWIAAIDRFELGDEEIRNSQIRVANFDMRNGVDMLLGVDFFLSHHIYVSSVSRRLFFSYNGGKVFGLLAEGRTKTVAAPASGASSRPGP
jgi:predicted aspartyl protease